MPFGRKARELEPSGGGETPWSKKAAGGLVPAEDMTLAAELRAHAPELHQAVQGTAALWHIVRELHVPGSSAAHCAGACDCLAGSQRRGHL